MENLSRRIFLRSTAAAATIPLATIPAMAASAAEELPVDRVNRLGWELAKALNDFSNGSMHAVVHPTGKRGEFSVGFVVSDFQLSPEKEAEAAALRLKAAMEVLAPGDYRFNINGPIGLAFVVRG